MNRTIYVSENVWNGIQYLREEEMLGNGSAKVLAAQYIATAWRYGNDRAARYWRKVLVSLRRLEQATSQANDRRAA